MSTIPQAPLTPITHRICEFANCHSLVAMGELAAAYTSVGRFDEAVEIMQKALNLVDKNDKNTLEQFNRHLDLYKTSKPYIDTRQKNPNASQ